MQLQIVAKSSVLCCHLANTNEKLGGLARAIPPFAKLLWFLLLHGQESIASSHGSQCGFCTPGFVMSMYALLRTNPRPTTIDMEAAFQGRSGVSSQRSARNARNELTN